MPRQPTKPKPTKRPVVRVMIAYYPRSGDQSDIKSIREVMEDAVVYDRVMDYRRPRVVSVRRVRGGK